MNELFMMLFLTVSVKIVNSQLIPPARQIQQQQQQPPPTQQQQSGLGFSASVQQAKQQIHYLFAGEKPVKESIDKMEDYYMDIEEKDMRKLHPRMILRRPACKVLPDPQPGLVNPLLVAPTQKYRPLHRDERFFGEFAPPVSYQFVPQPEGSGVSGNLGTLPPLTESFNQPPGNINPNPNINNMNQNPYPNAYPNQNQNPNNINANANVYSTMIPVPFPVIQKETVYSPNPFYGYKDGEYNASSDYFQHIPTSTVNDYQQFATTTATATPTPYFPTQISQVSITPTRTVDNAEMMASMSAALASNSAIIASISYSLEIASLNSVWSAKEESLRSKLAQYSATATATTTAHRRWTW